MPKSRGRNGRRNRPSNTARKAQLRVRSRQRAELGPYVDAISAANEREAAGDANGALGIIVQTPRGPDGKPMWVPWRIDRIGLLSFLALVLPKWIHARWMVAQCANQLTVSSVERTNRAVELAFEAEGLLGLELTTARRTWLGDHDWIVHQLAVHDFGGLAEFIESKPAVANLAGDIRSWASAPMGGFRLERESDHELVWTDLASDDEVTTINLGAAEIAASGRCVIGRVVACDGVRLFATMPARASEDLARAVAANPSDWLEKVKDSGEAFPVSAFSDGADASLFTDVPDHRWRDELMAGVELDQPDYDDDGNAIERSDEELDSIAAEVILSLLRGSIADTGLSAPCVGAALLDFEVWSRLVQWVGPEHMAGVAVLADRLVGPAGDVCRTLAQAAQETA